MKSQPFRGLKFTKLWNNAVDTR